MNCHKLIYKPYRKSTPYEGYLQRQKQKQQKQKKQLFYEEMIKFRQSRYPLDFLKQLQEKINPFELSLEKLKELFSQKHPEYSNQLVNQSVEHIFNRKCQESQMVKQSAMVIQYGDQYIRNGRKLIKQDFSFDFSKYLQNGEQSYMTGGANTGRGHSSSRGNNPQNVKSFSKGAQKMKQQQENRFTGGSRGQQALSSQRQPLTSDRLLTNRSRADSPSKIMEIMKRTQRFNQILLQEIKKDKKRFDNLEDIHEGTQKDTINYNYEKQVKAYTDRSRNNQSIHTFKDSDLVVRPDILDTGRSQVEQLNFILSSLNFQEAGQQTRRSGKSQKTIRINRDVKQQLFTAKGSLKLDLVRRAIQHLKKQNKMASGDTSRRTK